MSIIDRSPGGFIAIANTVLYATVLAEVGMLMSGSAIVLGAVMALIVALAAGLCAFIMRLMGSESYIVGENGPPAPVAAVAPERVEDVAATPARRRAGRTGVPALS
jgi:hypothetical protein